MRTHNLYQQYLLADKLGERILANGGEPGVVELDPDPSSLGTGGHPYYGFGFVGIQVTVWDDQEKHTREQIRGMFGGDSRIVAALDIGQVKIIHRTATGLVGCILSAHLHPTKDGIITVDDLDIPEN